MNLTMLTSEIHRATVTDCDLHDIGSITTDPAGTNRIITVDDAVVTLLTR